MILSSGGWLRSLSKALMCGRGLKSGKLLLQRLSLETLLLLQLLSLDILLLQMLMPKSLLPAVYLVAKLKEGRNEDDATLLRRPLKEPEPARRNGRDSDWSRRGRKTSSCSSN